MKKSILFFVAIFVIATISFAQNQLLTVGKAGSEMNQTVLLLSNDNQTTIRFDVNQLGLIEVATNDGNAFLPMSDKAPLMLEKGNPELFYLTTSFIIPDRGSSELEITYGGFQDFENIEIAPSKGSLPRSIDPATVPYVKGEPYNQNAFFPGTLASLREPFIMRDVRGQSLDVYPLQYNPVTKVLRVYSEITITVNYTENEGVNEFTTQKRHKTIEPEFNAMYSRLFINNFVIQQRGYPTGEEGEILIICHTPWVDEMQPYIDWKRTIGRKTTIVPTSDISPLTNANIKTYIENYYNHPDHNLAYVLLVGDYQQVPVHQVGSTRTDLPYVRFTSGNYLDALIGRMSCETPEHVQTQVQRSIWYEKEIATSDTWLSVGQGVARNEGGYPNGHDGYEKDYQHMDNIRERLLTYGYNTVYQDYDGSCPSIPNTTASIISQHFNAGLGVTNYCNHGEPTGWSVAGYNNSHVNALQNAGKLPYIFSVACNNGEFGPWQYNTSNAVCFAETWLRATKSGQPTGAVAFFGATISIAWSETMTAQDEFVDLCLGITHTAGGFNYGISDKTIRTISGAMLNATQRMLMRHGNGCLADYNSWLVFGDPTLNFRTKTPEEMTITHLPSIPTGATEFTVECDVDGAVAAITYNDETEGIVILGVAKVADGVAEIVFDEPLDVEGELTLAITGFNKVAYIATIPVGGEVELFPPQNLTYKVENANHVILEWDEPESTSLSVTGYNVYRDGELITPESASVVTTFTDIVPANGEYEYYVTALYGPSLESDPCEPVTVNITGMCVPIGTSIIVEQTEGANIRISWEAPEYEGTELAGYNVYREGDDEPLNEEIIPANELNFLDENVETDVELCYQVQVVYNDCDDLLITEKECITILSVKELSVQTYSIYPNPAKSELNISGAVAPSQVSIHNLMGQTMFETHQCTKNMKISVAHLPAGIYFIKIASEKGNITKKLVIEN